MSQSKPYVINAVVLAAVLGFCLGCATAQAGQKTFAPEFFAFRNGLPVGSFEEQAKLLKELGYDGVCSADSGRLAERVAVYDQYGLKVQSLYLEATKDPITESWLKVIENRGALLELYVRNMTPETIESIRQTADFAGKMNIRVALYPHYGFAVATVRQALDLVEKVNHPNLGVIFNLCHFLKSEKAEDMEAVLNKAAPHLFAVSTSGADTDGTDWGALIQPLNQGTFPQERLFSALRKIGFNGPVGLQCYGVTGDKRTNLKISISAWNEVLGSVN